MDFTWISDPTALVALATLVVMEVVLGIDNLIFISILTNKLPEHQRAKARRIGIGHCNDLGQRIVQQGAEQVEAPHAAADERHADRHVPPGAGATALAGGAAEPEGAGAAAPASSRKSCSPGGLPG